MVNSKEYKKEEVDAAVNETNREVKFIKAMVLNNGSISLNYDHRINNGEDIGEIVENIIKTLYIASEYLVLKLKSRWDGLHVIHDGHKQKNSQYSHFEVVPDTNKGM